METGAFGGGAEAVPGEPKAGSQGGPPQAGERQEGRSQAGSQGGPPQAGGIGQEEGVMLLAEADSGAQTARQALLRPLWYDLSCWGTVGFLTAIISIDAMWVRMPLALVMSFAVGVLLGWELRLPGKLRQRWDRRFIMPILCGGLIVAVCIIVSEVFLIGTLWPVG
ncbi:MAG: hypothetical protein LBE08_08645, partial [Bifidobacteriaceae bacterium]|nr:hypothetical protein [Bifidobacteriaceae bacterium]